MINDIKNTGELKGAIDDLERSKQIQQEQLADSFRDKMESLKPRNLIKSSVTEMSSTPLKKNILMVATTTLAVMLIKKLLTRKGAGGLKTIIVTAAVSAIVKEVLRPKTKPAV
jgi:hypothetical protein